MFTKCVNDKLNLSESSMAQRSPSPNKVVVGLTPVGDENAQNYRIQMAVNRYNSNVLSPYYQQFPMTGYRCSSPKSHRIDVALRQNGPMKPEGLTHCRPFILAKPRRVIRRDDLSAKKAAESFVSGYEYPTNPFYTRQRFPKCHIETTDLLTTEKKQQMSPEMRYRGPGQFPTCVLTQPYLRQPPKYNIMAHIKAQSPGLPVSRVLDDSAEKYLDLKSTRSVLDVLQDLSRKRIHGKDELDDNSKRLCKGLGGDMMQEGEVIYKPLFVPKSRSPLHPKKDQTTQTLDSPNSCEANISNSQDLKAELRRKLALQNNEIFASLSSSLPGTHFTKRKRVADSSKVYSDNDVSECKKKKIGDDNTNDSVPPELIGSTLETPLSQNKARKSIEKSPRSPPTKDRLMSIYYDMKDSKELKLNAIKSMQTSPGESQFIRSAASPESSNVKSNDIITTPLSSSSLITPKIPLEIKDVPEANVEKTTSPLSKEKSSPSNKLYGMPAVLTTSTTPTTAAKLFNSAPSFMGSSSTSTTGPTFSFSPSQVTSASTSVTATSFSPILAAGNTKPQVSASESAPKEGNLSLPAVVTTTTASSPIVEKSLQASLTPKMPSFSPGSNDPSKLGPLATPAFGNTAKTPFTFGPTLKDNLATEKSDAGSIKAVEKSVTKEIPKFSFGAVSPVTNLGPEKIVSPNVPISKKSDNSTTSVSSFTTPQSLNIASKKPGSVFARLGDVVDQPINFGTPKTTDTASSVTPVNTVAQKENSFTPNLNFGQTNKTSPFGQALNAATTISNSNVASPFSFGAQPKMAESNSNQTVPTFGSGSQNLTSTPVNASPPFSFGSKTAAVTTLATAPFAFAQNPTAITTSATSTPFAFGSNNTPITTSATSTPFAFGSNTTPITTSAPFAFGSNTTPITTSAPFAFGPNSTEIKTSTTTAQFGFGTNISSVATSATTTPFAFGSQTAATTSSTAPLSAPFTFGTAVATPATTASIFGQNSNEKPTASTVIFGQNTSSTTAGGAFSFPPTANTNTSTPPFSFGGVQKPIAQAAPNPVLGTSASTTAPFAFGLNTATTTSSVFGANSTTTPLFGQATTVTTASTLFGQGLTTSSTFGTTMTTTVPAFSQVASSAAASPLFSQASTTSSSASNTVFGTSIGFTQPAGKAPFSFGGNNSFGAVPNSSTAVVPSFGTSTVSQPVASTFGAPSTTSVATFGQSTNTFSFSGSSNSAFGQPPVPQSTTSFGGTSGQQSATSAFGGASALGQATPFQFGAAATTTTSNANSAFAFGAKTAGEAQPFTFGAPNTSTVAFGAHTGSTSAFGAVSSAISSPFGQLGSGAPAPAFGVSASTATTSPFTPAPAAFGTPSATPTTTSAATPFGFGGVPTNKPVFNFGASGQPPAPAAPFTFGNTSQTSGVSSGFNFNTGSNASGGFNFSAAPAFGQTTAQPSNFGSAPQTPAAAAFTSPFGTNTPGAFSMPGTFSIGSGSSQARPRSTVRRRRQ